MYGVMCEERYLWEFFWFFAFLYFDEVYLYFLSGILMKEVFWFFLWISLSLIEVFENLLYFIWYLYRYFFVRKKIFLMED